MGIGKVEFWESGKMGIGESRLCGKWDFGKVVIGKVEFWVSWKMGFREKGILGNFGKWDFGKVGFWHEK